MTEAATTAKNERQQKLTKAYTNATRALREAHRDEFNRLMASEAKQLGVEWTPPKSAAEKAEAQLQEILKQHPELATKLAQSTEVPMADTPPTVAGAVNK